MSAVDATSHVRRRLQASQLRLSDNHPFFGALLLMAPVEVTEAVETASTDGRWLRFNPQFVEPLTTAQLDGLVVHELLHCAMLHLVRRGHREPLLWNVAADVVVNGVIRGMQHLDLPPGCIEEPSLASLAVEEVYERIRASASVRRRAEASLTLVDVPATAGCEPGGEVAAEAAERLGSFWADAVERAMTVARMSRAGNLPSGVERMFREVHLPQLDWRSTLWRHLVRTPDDFQGFDRRHVWQGLYVDALEGQSLDVDVCIDTSGSVGDELLSEFIAEVRGIARSYPRVRCRLYYCDTDCAGPFDIDAQGEIPVATGGGGTDFQPFFRKTDPASDPVAAARPEPALAVYLTDGEGTFPSRPPARPVLWVVSPGGRESSAFPFGTVVRMKALSP